MSKEITKETTEEKKCNCCDFQAGSVCDRCGLPQGQCKCNDIPV